MRKLWTAIALLVVLVLVLVLAFGSDPLTSQLAEWKVLPQPEQFTQLYFTSLGSIPQTYFPGRPQAVGFTVQNQGTNDTHYDYQIIQQSGADASVTRILARGSFRLASGQKSSPIVDITPRDLGPRAQITVTLQNVNESIDYWVTRSTR